VASAHKSHAVRDIAAISAVIGENNSRCLDPVDAPQSNVTIKNTKTRRQKRVVGEVIA
jgi:hypothetical protein